MGRKLWQRVPVEKTCEWCKETKLIPRQNKFCLDCHDKARKGILEKVCALCGAPILGGWKRLYCDICDRHVKQIQVKRYQLYTEFIKSGSDPDLARRITNKAYPISAELAAEQAKRRLLKKKGLKWIGSKNSKE